MQRMLWTYAGVFLSAMLLGLVVTQGMVWFAHRIKLFAPRNTRSVHALPTPRIGGVAIFVSLILVTVGMLLFDTHASEVFRELHSKLLVLFVCGGFVFLFGLIDDIWGMRASAKLAVQLIAAIVVCSYGIRIDQVTLFGWWFGWMAWPVTILWIVGITNAVNLIDGLDGLSAGICATTCVVIGVFSAYTGQVAMAILMAILFGSLVGFLFFNFNPAKIFLGDSGSMFLGFFLATSSVICTAKVATVVGLLLPALALGLPLFDMLISIVRRVLERRSIFSADRGHIHHRLLDMGLNHRNTVIVMYLITLAIVGLAALMMFLREEGGELIVLVVSMLILLAVFRIAGVLRFRKMFEQVQSNLARMREFRNDRKDFEHMQNRIKRAWTFKQWWLAVRRMARKMGFERIVIQYRDPASDEIKTLTYSRPTDNGAEDTMHLSIPVRSQLAKVLIHVEIDVPVQDSLEAIGRRVSLFGRLLDEHTLDTVFEEQNKIAYEKQTLAASSPGENYSS